MDTLVRVPKYRLRQSSNRVAYTEPDSQSESEEHDDFESTEEIKGKSCPACMNNSYIFQLKTTKRAYQTQMKGTMDPHIQTLCVEARG